MNSPVQTPARPDVSFVIACYNAMDYIAPAVRSALDQTGVSVEVLIIDDHSSDESYDFICTMAEQDSRIRVFQTPENRGPGGARNVGIENVRGQWYAVLDSDDLLAPERSAALLKRAEELGADMVADNLLLFGEGLSSKPYLDEPAGNASGIITLDSYFAGTRMFGPKPNFGFLKPMIRTEVLQSGRHRYREDLRIGEDDELVVRLLLAGLKYGYEHQPLYHYRKHDESISHRLSSQNSSRMLASETEISRAVEKAGAMCRSYCARYDSIADAAAFTRSVEALKRRDLISAIQALVERPKSVRHYSMPIKVRLERLLGNTR